MLKTILLFIKAHAVATTITATVVVGTAVATPIVVSNYMLDKNIRDNLDMLVSSDFKTSTDNQVIEDSQEIENNEMQNDIKLTANNKEPLTFRIEKVYNNIFNNSEEDEIVIDYTKGNSAINNAKSQGIEYKIVPSYDKDYTEWSKQEKEAYQKAFEDVAKMAEEDYQNNVKNDQNNLKKAQEEVERVLNIIDSSYSKDYSILCFLKDGKIMPLNFKYNSYTKLYSGSGIYFDNCDIVTKSFGNMYILQSGVQASGITKEEFRNKLYPKYVQTINQELEGETKQEELKQLNELYHLSD